MERWEAIQMIMRAMTNYKELVGQPSETMRHMARWITENKGKYESMQ